MTDFISALRSKQLWDSALVVLLSPYALVPWIHNATGMKNVGMYVALVIVLFNGRWRRTLPLLRHPLVLLLLALICWFALSTVWSLHPGKTIQAIEENFKEYFLVFPPLVYLLLSARRRRMFACVLGGLGIVIATVNGAQYVRELLTDPSLLYNLKGHRKWAYPLVVFIPFAIAQWRLNRGKVAGFWMLALVIESFMVIGSGARGAWISLFAVFALWGCVEFNRRQITGVAVIACVLAALAYLVLPPTIVKDRLAKGADTSLRTTGTWGPTIDMMRDRPVLGYGYGRTIYNDEFNRRAPANDDWSIKKSIGPHSVYLEIGFSGGLIGLIVLVIFFAGTLLHGLRGTLRATNLDDRLLALAATSAFLGYFVTRGVFESVRWSPLVVLLPIIVQCSWATRKWKCEAIPEPSKLL